MPTCPNCGSVQPEGTIICSCGTTLRIKEMDDERVAGALAEELMRENINILISRAKRLEEKGEYLEAIELYYDVLAIDPRWPAVPRKIGNAYFKAGLYEKALDEYYNGCNGENDFTTQRAIGNALFELERYDEAIEHYQTAVNIVENSGYYNPHLDERFTNDAKKVKEFEKKEAMRLKEKNELLSGIYNEIGWAYNAKADYDNAIEYYEKAIYHDHDRANNWNCKAIALENKGEFADAVKFYEIALKMNPEDEVIRNNRVQCLKNYARAYRNGTYTKKCESLREALELTDGAEVSNVSGNLGHVILDFDE